MNNLTLDIDLKAMKHNLDVLSKGKRVCLMVKANCYGLGYEMIKHYIDLGVDYFGVSTIDEALEIRKVSQDVAILVVSYISQEDYEIAVLNNIMITLYDFNVLNYIDQRAKVQLKFDVGMGRVGFKLTDCEKLIYVIEEMNLDVVGIYSHFPDAGNVEVTNKQIDLFKSILATFERDFEYIHMQNTLGCLIYDLDFCNLVRPGIGITGLLGDEYEAKKFGQNLTNALTLKAPVIMNKAYDGLIGYGLTQHVTGNVATLRIGYADGLLRCFQGYKFKNGSEIVGRICMCQTMLLTENEIDFQEIFGQNESIYNLCKVANTISYELLVLLSNRVHRNVL